MKAKLCICGRSKKFPICDNSHIEKGWSCASEPGVGIGFYSSPRYENLALKLAFHYKGIVCTPGEKNPLLETLLVIIDTTDVDAIVRTVPQITAREKIIAVIGAAGNFLDLSSLHCDILVIDDDNPLRAFRHICKILDEKTSDQAFLQDKDKTLKSAFLSHAVKDEPLIIPIIQYLRKYFSADLFNCGDSISPGTTWQTEIMTALKAREYFIFLISQVSLSSQFCSFEIGVAYALNKPIMLISLDGSLPPTFIQHIQTIDILRIGKQKPWLDQQDILIDELLKILTY